MVFSPGRGDEKEFWKSFAARVDACQLHEPFTPVLKPDGIFLIFFDAFAETPSPYLKISRPPNSAV